MTFEVTITYTVGLDEELFEEYEDPEQEARSYVLSLVAAGELDPDIKVTTE